MGSNGSKRDMYAASERSLAQRIVLTIAMASCTGLAWWLLEGSGIELLGSRFGWAWSVGDDTRRLCLAVALSIYWVRLIFTQFMFLKRAVSWRETWLIAVWVLCIYLLLAIEGGTNRAPVGRANALGIVLFVLGSWTNSYSEYERHIWKQHPENRGRLYTLGLFRFSRHPNYLGDVISFSGLCMISGRWPTFVIPLIMLAGFVFANIPMLDSHLRDHYGAAFDQYAARTRKLIPFIY
jgi:protein-S-isoprenylcysteine O-methyltransferase Ste14